MTLASPSHRPTLLPFLGLLRVEGPDAVSFLQGQLTHDLRLLEGDRTLLAACCSPQGRVIALPRLRRQGETIYALLPAELVEPLAARLRRFVLRAKVEVQVANDLFAVCATATALAAMPVARDSPVTWANLATVWFDYARGRKVFAARAEAVGRVAEPPSDDSATRRVADAWWSADIADGLPQVFVASAESFVPQMLNLDRLDAISFTKGCYTGQEIVARTQHLGRIKRRTFRFHLPAGPVPAPLEPLTLDGSRVAEVVMAAPRDHHVELLAVTSLAARYRELRAQDGRTATPLDLPYSIPENDPDGRGPSS